MSVIVPEDSALSLKFSGLKCSSFIMTKSLWPNQSNHIMKCQETDSLEDSRTQVHWSFPILPHLSSVDEVNSYNAYAINSW